MPSSAFPISPFPVLELAKLFAFSFICFSLRKTENDGQESIFVFRLFVLVRQKTENDKTEVDFCFSFICLSLRKKKQKTIKRKLIFVFPYLFKFAQKKNRKR